MRVWSPLAPVAGWRTLDPRGGVRRPGPGQPAQLASERAKDKDRPVSPSTAESAYTVKDKVAVVGIGETTYYKRGGSPVSEFVLACEAILKAAEDAGIDVQGYRRLCVLQQRSQ